MGRRLDSAVTGLGLAAPTLLISLVVVWMSVMNVQRAYAPRLPNMVMTCPDGVELKYQYVKTGDNSYDAIQPDCSAHSLKVER